MPTATKKCTGCKERYATELETWYRSPNGCNFHDFACAANYANAKRKKAVKKEQGKKKREVSLMSKQITHHWTITCKVMQEYARLRDLHYNRPCIACGKHYMADKSPDANSPDGGHWKTKGAHKNLMFNLWNINYEHRFCNSFDSNHLANMRDNLIERHGLEKVLYLESNPPMPEQWRDKKYLARMRRIFKQRMKRYKSA